MPLSPEQHHLCQRSQGVRAAPSRVQGLAAPVPQAVVGWPAACQLSWRRCVQADDSPGGLSVRRPLPPCQRLEHQATNRPTHTSPPPPPPRPKGTPSARTPHTQARQYLPPASATAEVRGLSAVRHALRPRQPGAPNPVESRRDGCADRGPGCLGEALTQTKPKTRTQPPPPKKKGYPGAGGYGGQNPKIHWGIIFGPKMMILQGVRR